VTTAPRTAKPRRQRGVVESLLSIVLLLEAILIFFVMLTVYGLKILEPAVVFGGGAALFVLLILAGRAVRYPAGIAFGWVLQVGIIALGLLIPLMYVIGALFAAIWTYCLIRGRSIEHQKAAFAATQQEPRN
jgi:hypothetical protein